MEIQMLQGELLLEEPLAAYNTWRVGGRADKLYKPYNLADLVLFLQTLPESEPVVFLGLGSNSLILDSGINATVILTQGCLKTLELISNPSRAQPSRARKQAEQLDHTEQLVAEDHLIVQSVYVEAGVSCATLARFCARNALSGAEFWAGIPGTMGGALRMNAGCAGAETWDSVFSVCTINKQGIVRTRMKDEFTIGYRSVSGLFDQEWFVSATLQFPCGDKTASLEKIKDLLAHRAATQPTGEYNCGSVFRNPPADYAGRLIESCNLKGFRLGGAEVSTKHANFIINKDGKGTATDIANLVLHVQNTVFEQTGQVLVPEVHILGDKHG
jgi:UDP-N-acetylmuramate dehydrogenase